MNLRYPSLLSLALFAGIIVVSSCKKSDPAPLGAQTNATLLAGEKGKSKSWKLNTFNYVASGGASTPLTLPACFSDNIYTFNNNDDQTYSDVEGASMCYTTDPTNIESGTWAFSLNGVNLSVSVISTASTQGLFSPEAILRTDSSGNNFAINVGYPFPSVVKSLTATTMVLVETEVLAGTTYQYTLSFTSL